MKKNSKIWGRLWLWCFLLKALLKDLFKKRTPPQAPAKILVLHTLLFGDAVMVTPLLKALRTRFPQAQIILALPPFLCDFFKTNPYQIECLAFDPRNVATFAALKKYAPFDLAILPVKNHLAFLCRALGTRWIIGFEGDLPQWINFFIDQKIPYPPKPTAFPDMLLALCPAPVPSVLFAPEEWQKIQNGIVLPPQPYIVLHVGAGNPTRFWNPKNWQIVARALIDKGFQIVLTGLETEKPLIEKAMGEIPHHNWAGQCNISELFEVFKNAKCLISPDTGVAHLVKLTGTPSVTLFGPGSSVVLGPGEFWKNHPYRALTEENIPCRRGGILFKRKLPWARHCCCAFKDCPTPHWCMDKITPESVLDAVYSLLKLS